MVVNDNAYYQDNGSALELFRRQAGAYTGSASLDTLGGGQGKTHRQLRRLMLVLVVQLFAVRMGIFL